MADTRLPYHARMMALFASGYDTDCARLIAADEHRLTLEQTQRLDADERPSTPPGRMVGFDRGRRDSA